VSITNIGSEHIVNTVEFFPTDATTPFQSSKDLATQDAKQLTHALLYPQPAGPFTQVSGDQMLAIARLKAAFEGVLPTHKTSLKPPPG
jgi:hypothetical protein